MKSREKVIRQKHIREIPNGVFNQKFGLGLVSRSFKGSNITPTQKAKRIVRKHIERGASRRVNRDR